MNIRLEKILCAWSIRIKFKRQLFFFFNILFPSGKALQVEEISSVILAGKKRKAFQRTSKI